MGTIIENCNTEKITIKGNNQNKLLNPKKSGIDINIQINADLEPQSIIELEIDMRKTYRITLLDLLIFFLKQVAKLKGKIIISQLPR